MLRIYDVMIRKLLLLCLFPVSIMAAQVSIKCVKTFTVGLSTDAITMCATPDLLFFGSNNNNSTEGTELWVSDGTTSGTKMLKNINESYRSSNPRWLKQALGRVIFAADVTTSVNNQVKTNTKLFISDGTETGTIALCDLSYNYPASVDVTNSIYYGKELNGKYYFSAETDIEEAELWVTDGTPAGTKMLKDIYAATNFASFPKNFEVFGDKLYFTAKNDVYGEELWVSDGTEEGTILVKDIYPGNKGYVTGQLKAYKGHLYFAAADKDANKGVELWMSDGTAEGTVFFKDINPDYRDANPSNFFVVNDKLYFKATNYQTGTELYVSDGTAEGTTLVQDINPGTASSSPTSFVAVGNVLYFIAKDAVYGNELRKLIAGSQTVELVKDIAVGNTDGLNENFFPDARFKTLGRIAFGNNLIFTARTDYSSGYHVWITDGTSEGTQILLYNNMAGTYVAGFTEFKNEIYFWGNYNSKYDLYKISGPTSDTKELNSEEDSYRVYQNDRQLIIENYFPKTNTIVFLLTANGQLVAEADLQGNKCGVDISGLNRGLYIVNVLSGNTNSTLKVIIK